MRNFSSGRTPYLIATNVAARGLDIDDIVHVINYDMPTDIDDYVHRIGRTGRAGKPGLATAFVTEENANIVPKLIEILDYAQQEVPAWLDNMRSHHRRGSTGSYRGGGGGYGRGRGGGAHFGGRDYRSHGNNNREGGNNNNNNQGGKGNSF